MTGMTHSSFESIRRVESGRDVSWYGTLALLAACLGVLVAAGFLG
jgi:hypothetical protein